MAVPVGWSASPTWHAGTVSSHPFPSTSLEQHDGRVVGPERQPKQMLADQEYDGHTSVHDDATADKLGLTGAPIEGPTHFSQFDPIGFDRWGERWFSDGCISAHFQTMVIEGESVIASADDGDGTVDSVRIDAAKGDGTPVLTGTISVGDATTELAERLAKAQSREPGELFIVDQVTVGALPADDRRVSVDADTANGNLYPFSLAQKLAAITEPSDWYVSGDNPWGRPILPFEMYSVLAHKIGSALPVRGPAVGLFLDLEVRALGRPLFVGEEYVLERAVVAVGQSRKVESHWVDTTVRHAESGEPAATVLLHSGVFKASYADYPTDRLT